MKNLKLLLATTAMLSTAMAANADTTYYGSKSSVDFNADVIIVSDLNISKGQDLSFGVIAPKYTDTSNKAGSQVAGTITISPQGNVTPTNLTYFGKAQPATVSTSTPGSWFNEQGLGARVELSNEIVLKDGNTVCGTVNNFVIGSNSTLQSDAIGATFTYNPGALTYNNITYSWNNLHCTGTFTATLVLYDLQ